MNGGRTARGLMAVVCVLIAVAPGCSNRTRENPFDPRNPETAGSPSWLAAAARDGFVDLRWSDGGLPGIEGFTILRGTDPAALELVTEIPPGYHLFRDVGLARDVTYYFAVGFRFRGQEPLLTAVEEATPGPEVPWVLDSEESPLVLLSADGRAVVTRQAQDADLVDLSVDPTTGRAWCTDFTQGQVVAYSKDGVLDGLWEGFDSPTRLSVDPTQGGVWIVSYDAGVLLRVDSVGRRSVIDTTLVRPLDVEASAAGGCWVSDELGLVHRYSRTGAHTVAAQVDRPTVLSAAPDNTVWLADPVAKEIVRVSGQGVVARAGDFDGPYGVAATPDGGCWVADRKRVIKVNGNGAVALTVDGFEGAKCVAFDTRSSECWVGDAIAGAIVRVGPDGGRVGSMNQVTSPFVVAGRWESKTR